MVAGCGIWFPDQESNPGPLELGAGVLNTEPPEKSLLDNFKTSPGLLYLLPAIRLHIPASQPSLHLGVQIDDFRPQSSTTALTLAAAFPKHNTFASVDTKLGPASGSLWELFPLSRGFSLRSPRVQVISPFPSPLGPSRTIPYTAAPFCVPPAHAILGHCFLQGAVAMGKNLITFLIGIPTGTEAPGGQALNSCLSIPRSLYPRLKTAPGKV